MDNEAAIWQFIRDDILAGRPEVVDRDTSLLETGIIDSMALFRLIAFLEERFRVRIPDDDLVAENFQSVGAIVNYVARKVQPSGGLTG